jgi:hypothetical protein
MALFLFVCAADGIRRVTLAMGRPPNMNSGPIIVTIPTVVAEERDDH